MSSIILEAEAENYTPLMAGDALGTVTFTIGNNTLALAHLGKPLIGKSRWLLRTLIQALGYASSHRDAEARPTLFVHRRGNKELKMGLVKLLFGSVNPAWRALYTIKVTNKNGYKVDRDTYYHQNSELTVTRYKLITMGAEAGQERVPIKPGSLVLKLEILRRPLANMQIKTSSGTVVRIEDLDVLATGLVLGVLRLFGIGQGANRGFGRFTLKPSTIKARTEEIRSLIKLLLSLDNPDNRVDYILRKYLETMMEIIARLNNKNISILDTNIYIKSYWINDNIAQCIERRIYQKLPGMRGQKLPRDTIHRSLELIAIATLKTAWKTLNREQRSGGAAYHTWVLGLPRRQKISNPIRCKSQVQNSVPTGYLLDTNYWSETGIKLIPVNSKQGLYAVEDEDEGKFADGRRQSPIIIFPLDPEGRVITIIGFMPYDLADLTDNIYHVGGLVNTRERKPKFIDVIRLANIKKVANSGTNRVKYQCKRTSFVNDRAIGIAKPGVRTHRGGKPVSFSSDDEFVRMTYDAALEFIERILTMRCGGYGWR